MEAEPLELFMDPEYSEYESRLRNAMPAIVPMLEPGALFTLLSSVTNETDQTMSRKPWLSYVDDEINDDTFHFIKPEAFDAIFPCAATEAMYPRISFGSHVQEANDAFWDRIRCIRQEAQDAMDDDDNKNSSLSPLLVRLDDNHHSVIVAKKLNWIECCHDCALKGLLEKCEHVNREPQHFPNKGKHIHFPHEAPLFTPTEKASFLPRVPILVDDGLEDMMVSYKHTISKHYLYNTLQGIMPYQSAVPHLYLAKVVEEALEKPGTVTTLLIIGPHASGKSMTSHALKWGLAIEDDQIVVISMLNLVKEEGGKAALYDLMGVLQHQPKELSLAQKLVNASKGDPPVILLICDDVNLAPEMILPKIESLLRYGFLVTLNGAYFKLGEKTTLLIVFTSDYCIDITMKKQIRYSESLYSNEEVVIDCTNFDILKK